MIKLKEKKKIKRQKDKKTNECYQPFHMFSWSVGEKYFKIKVPTNATNH